MKDLDFTTALFFGVPGLALAGIIALMQISFTAGLLGLAVLAGLGGAFKFWISGG